jgi:hypothetical protein
MTMEVHDVTDTDHTHRDINSLCTTTGTKLESGQRDGKSGE